MTVKDYIDGNTQGRQDSMTARSAPTPRPTIAAKAAPQVATNLPKARPARKMDPKLLAERDAKEKLDHPWHERLKEVCAPEIANLMITNSWPQYKAAEDNYFNCMHAFEAKCPVPSYHRDGNKALPAGCPGAVSPRLPVVAGAGNGTLTALASSSPAQLWKQQGKDPRKIAGNGKSAMHCVSLETIASGDSNTSAAVKGRVIVNHCSDEVEINWCNSPGECERESGNTWTVQPGYSWPVSSEGEVRWSACHGANTASTVKGSYGLRFYCNAPLVESKRSGRR